MRLCVLSLALVLCYFSLANAESKKDIPSVNNKAIEGLAIENSLGELTYLVQSSNGKMERVSLSFFTDNLEKLVTEAKKVVCDMNVLPETVTISSVVVSVTYNTKQLCPSKKS